MPRPSRVFRRFLTSYIIILMIPTIAGFMSYRTAIAVTESISIENSVTQLEKSKELLESRMAEVEGFTRQLAINRDLNILMNESVSSDRNNAYGIWKMMRDVLTFGQTNDFLQHFYIYLHNYDVVLTPGSAYYRPEHYYETYRYTDITFEEWKKEILGGVHRSEIIPLRPIISNQIETSVITYMQSLPLDSFNGLSPAIVVVLIDQKSIDNLLSGVIDRYGGWAHIADADGHTIALKGIDELTVSQMSTDSSFDQEKLSQFYKDDLVITIQSSTNKWVYKAGIPKQVLMKDANKIESITWIVTGVALFIGIVVGFLLSYRNSEPIMRMIGVMKEQFGHESIDRNEYDFLHGNVAKMITSNKRLESELHRQAPLIRDMFLKRLVAGEFFSREEVIAAAAQARAGLSGDVGYVGIMQINGYSIMDNVEVLNEINAARFILKQALSDHGSSVLMTDLGADKIIFLFAFSDKESVDQYGKEEIAKTLQRISSQAFQEYRISITMVMGGLFEEVMEVSQSLEQAKQALEHAVSAGGRELLWYEEAQQESATYYYPLELELRLISMLRAGELNDAKKLVESIFAHNREQRGLSFEMKQQLIGELKGTLLKLLDQKVFIESTQFDDLKNAVIGISGSEQFSFIQAEIEAIMSSLCGLVQEKKNDGHLRIVEQIKSYICSSYQDATLTLYRVAEQVERPEKFISQLFKEVTGTNLSDYIEQLRMDQAIVLLKDRELTVDEIAMQVGYNSSHSFRRAFKRVRGVSPSLYRQTVTEEAGDDHP